MARESLARSPGPSRSSGCGEAQGHSQQFRHTQKAPHHRRSRVLSGEGFNQKTSFRLVVRLIK
jgi:hypothetical protein